MKNKLIALSLSVLCIFALFGCGGEKLDGTYRCVDSAYLKYYIQLKSNGKCSFYRLMNDEIKENLFEGVSIFYGTYKYKKGDEEGTISITVKYPNNGNKKDIKTKTFKGKVQKDGSIRIKLFWQTEDRDFKKQQ